MTHEHYGAIYSEKFDRMVRGLTARGLGLDEAEDSVQAAWAKGWEKLHQLRDEDCLAGWIWTIACHEADDRRKKRRRFREAPLEEGDIRPCVMNLTDQLDVTLAMHKCRPRHRNIATKLYFEGYTEQELAALWNISRAAVRERSRRMRRAMRDSLAAKRVFEIRAGGTASLSFKSLSD